MNEKKPILEIRDLKTHFYTDEGVIRGCDGVSLSVYEGEMLAVVGESGSGKSVMSMSILRLIPSPPGRYVQGGILLDGLNLLELSEKEMQGIRGNDIAVIFQEPMTSLNPVLTVGHQIMEPLRIHQNLSKPEARVKAVSLLRKAGIPAPEQQVDQYPAQMSGGMRQRVMIAMALACDPRILIADEPTSALDVTIQEQLMRLLGDLQRERNLAVIFITHDLGVVAETAHKVAVMYAGQIVEYGTVDDIFYHSGHPYVDGLRKCIPRLDIEQENLHVIKGMVPDPLNLPVGCKFAPRCPQAMEVCRAKEPPITRLGEEHYARCWLCEKPEEKR